MYTLMVKTHLDTMLKYLCKTNCQDPLKYKGSGKYWKRHLKIYGSNIYTEILYQTEDRDLFNIVCLEFSEKFDVVKSKQWANLINETGLDGGKTFDKPIWLEGYKHSEETKTKISKNNAKAGLGKPSPLRGYKHSDEFRKKMSDVTKGKPKSQAHKDSLSKSKIGKSLNLTNEIRIEKVIK